MTEGKKIKFYGTSWCPSSRRARRLLTEREIDFDWINIDKDPAGREFVLQVNNGYRSVPTIVFPDGDILVEPSTTELVNKLGS
jgi:mycoredoxin